MMSFLEWWERFKLITIRVTQPHKRRRVDRYSFPVMLLLIVFFFKSYLSSQLNIGTPYLMSTFIVVLSSWYGGLEPGIFATILAGILNNFLFLEPRFSLIGTGNATATVIFLLQGFFISMISEAKRYADSQKDDFISFASHELKNPLAVRKGYVALSLQIAKQVKNKKLESYLQNIDTSMDTTSALIDELLDLTRIDSGKLSLEKELFSLQKNVEEVVQNQRLISESHKIIFKGKTNKKVYTDRIRINQVLTNMITNAIKYSPGKKRIIVTISDKKDNVVISVQDFGVGISKDEQAKIFNKFYRVAGTKPSGLGLGLYISQQIARLSYGSIWVESSERKGSTFYLQLPIAKNIVLHNFHFIE